MKLRTVLLLSLCNTACAELPPVVGSNSGVTGQPVAVPKAPAPTATFENMKRIEQLQAEVQQLTGKVEEQAFQIEELKKQQKTMYTDFDDRLQALETKSEAGASAGESLNAPAPAVPAADASDPAVNSGSASPKAESQPEPAPAAKESGMSSSAAAPASAEMSTPVSDEEKRAYQQAYDLLRNGKTGQAISEFNTYLSTYPSSGYASNAQYWLGEAHRVNLDNAAARDAFNQVVNRYPNSAKVPDALYKLGIIEAEEKNPEKAREIFNKITTEFANSKAAVLAQKKLQTLESGAR